MPRRSSVRRAIQLAALLLVLAVALPTAVFADREHTVRPGQTLSAIAQRYRVRVSDLAAANRMGRNDPLRVGQVLKVPEPGVIYVRPGQSLASLANDHGVSVSDLARANRLRANASLRIGQRLVLPGSETAAARERAEERWGRPRRPGVVSLYRTARAERLRIRLLDNRGRARSAARRRLAHLFRHRGTNEKLLPHPRLVQAITRVSDHFGGRRVIVVSGYRPAGGGTRETSRHTQGRAVDLRIQGVPNGALRDYCKTLPRVGCGYYPNSSFVHIDVRDSSAYWVDTSRPGEPAQYRRRRGGGEDTEVGEGAEVTDDRNDEGDDVPEEDVTAPGDDQDEAVETSD